MENSNFILGSRQYCFEDSIDEVTVYFAQPLYHGQPVGCTFFFPKLSLRNSFCSKYKSSHTLNFWTNLLKSNVEVTADDCTITGLEGFHYSLFYCLRLLKKMSPDERIIYQAC